MSNEEKHKELIALLTAIEANNGGNPSGFEVINNYEIPGGGGRTKNVVKVLWKNNKTRMFEYDRKFDPDGQGPLTDTNFPRRLIADMGGNAVPHERSQAVKVIDKHEIYQDTPEGPYKARPIPGLTTDPLVRRAGRDDLVPASQVKAELDIQLKDLEILATMAKMYRDELTAKVAAGELSARDATHQLNVRIQKYQEEKDAREAEAKKNSEAAIQKRHEDTLAAQRRGQDMELQGRYATNAGSMAQALLGGYVPTGQQGGVNQTRQQFYQLPSVDFAQAKPPVPLTELVGQATGKTPYQLPA